MARITSFIYCLGAERIQGPDGQAINANGILTNITPEYVPGSFSFSIIFSMLGIEKSHHALQIKFINPDGQDIVNSNIIPIPFDQIVQNDPNGNLLPDDEKGLIMTMDLRNVIFKKDGEYHTEIFWDGIKLGEYKIYARGKNRIE